MFLQALGTGRSSSLGPVQPGSASPPNLNSTAVSNLALDLNTNRFDGVGEWRGGGGIGRVSEGFEVGAASEGERSREGEVSEVRHCYCLGRRMETLEIYREKERERGKIRTKMVKREREGLLGGKSFGERFLYFFGVEKRNGGASGGITEIPLFTVGTYETARWLGALIGA